MLSGPTAADAPPSKARRSKDRSNASVAAVHPIDQPEMKSLERAMDILPSIAGINAPPGGLVQERSTIVVREVAGIELTAESRAIARKLPLRDSTGSWLQMEARPQKPIGGRAPMRATNWRNLAVYILKPEGTIISDSSVDKEKTHPSNDHAWEVWVGSEKVRRLVRTWKASL